MPKKKKCDDKEIEDDEEELEEEDEKEELEVKDKSSSKKYSQKELLKIYEGERKRINKEIENLTQPDEEEQRLLKIEEDVSQLQRYVKVHHDNLEILNENFKLLIKKK